MLADLPPSSIVTFFRVPAALRMMDWPTEVEPVKAILSMSGWSVRVSPSSTPGPVITFSTPSGISASWKSSAIFRAVSGVAGEGLWTTVLPAARAGAIFVIDSSSGKLNGVMAQTTPSGSRRV